MRTILGPAPCGVCGKSVVLTQTGEWWFNGMEVRDCSRKGWRKGWIKGIHRCKGKVAPCLSADE